MLTSAFDYNLPEVLIAQEPRPRGEARMLVLHRRTGEIEHRKFQDLMEYVRAGDSLVVNDTRVIARKLKAIRTSGLPADVLLLHPEGEKEWRALIRPARRIRIGDRLTICAGNAREVCAEITGVTEEGGRILKFGSRSARDALGLAGEAPLPPYIHSKLVDEERYQTVYSEYPGSAAAPTAGLHFTNEMLERCAGKGIGLARITLHVGIDTFRPLRVAELDDHKMHGESVRISEHEAAIINATTGRIVAVGTTTVRALESAATGPRSIAAFRGETCLFIKPGFEFRVVDCMLTNFHLPKSTLLALVSAFAGRENILEAYRQAAALKYWFYSFGDAMLIL